MKKPLVYGAIFVGISLCIFAWWWTQPHRYIDRATNLSVPSADTLFSKSEGSGKIYLLKVESSYVRNIIDGCELHRGAFAAADQTSAASLSNDADFKALGLFTSNRIGCYITGKTETTRWDFYVKDSLLYFQENGL